MTASRNDSILDTIRYSAEGQVPEEIQSLGFFGTAGDVAKSTLYGGEQAVRSMFDLSSYTFGGDVSDVEDSFFTAPESMAGAFTGAISQFAAGSIITGGIIQGTLATLTALGIGAGAVLGAPVVAGGALLGGLAVTTARVAKGWNTYRKLKKQSKIFNYAHAGVVDFAAFRGEQGRFVDLLNDVPALENEVFSYISGDVDDTEFEGRLKNVLDGVIAGGMLDAAIVGLKRATQQRKVLAERAQSGKPMSPEEQARLEAEFDQQVVDEAELVFDEELAPITMSRYERAQERLQDTRYSVKAQEVERKLLGETPEGAAGIRDIIGRKSAEDLKPIKEGLEQEFRLKPDVVSDTDVVWSSDSVFRSGQELEDFQGKRGGVRGTPFDEEEGFILEMDANGFREDLRYLDDRQSSPESLVMRGKIGNVKTIYYNRDFWDGGSVEELYKLHRAFPDADIAYIKVDPETGTVKYDDVPGDDLDFIDELKSQKIGEQLNVNQYDLKQNKDGQFVDEQGRVIEGVSDEVMEAQGRINFGNQDLSDTAASVSVRVTREFIDEINSLKGGPKKTRKGSKPEATEKVGEEELFSAKADAFDKLSRVFQSTRIARKILETTGGDAKAVYAAARYAERLRLSGKQVSDHLETVLKDAQAMRDPSADSAVYHAIDALFNTVTTREELGSAFGFALGSLGPRFRNMLGNKVQRVKDMMPGTESKQQLLDTYRQLAIEARTSPAARKQLADMQKRILKTMKKTPDPIDAAKEIQADLALGAMGAGGIIKGMFKAVPEVFVTNVISGPKTLAIGLASPLFVWPTKALAELYGRAFELQTKADPNFAAKIMSEVRDDMSKSTMMMKNGYNILKLALKGDDMGKVMHNLGLQTELRQGRQVDRVAGSVADKLGWQTDGTTRKVISALYSTLVPGRVLPARIDRMQQLTVFQTEYHHGVMRNLQSKGLPAAEAEQIAADLTQQAMHEPEKLVAQFAGDGLMRRAAQAVDEGKYESTDAAVVGLASKTEVDAQDFTNIHEAAARKAQGMTYNRPLKDLLQERDSMSAPSQLVVSLGNSVSDIVKRHPSMRMFAPFLTIPTNIFATSTETLVGGSWRLAKDNLNKQLFSAPYLSESLDDFASKINSPDKSIRRQAIGQSYLAANIVGGFGTMLAMPGVVTMEGPGELPRITGSGPSDPSQRRAWQAAGFQPFSIRVGDSYVSYARAEPIATWLGFMVDMVQIAQFKQYAEDPETDELLDLGVMSAMAASMNQLTQKTFMQGLQDLTNILEADSDASSAWFKRTMASLTVPASIRQIGINVDPIMRDARTVGDKMLQSVPGMSQRLDTKRDLLGEPITRSYFADSPWLDAFMPTRVTEIKDDVVRNEFLKVPNDWRSMPTRYEGINMLDERLDIDGVSAYDAWQGQISNIKLRGKTMRQSLRVLFQDADYQALDPSPTTFGQDSGRVLAINRVMNAYKRAAFVQLAKDNPQIEREFKAVRQAARDRSQARRTPSPTLID